MNITKYLTIGILFIGMTALMGCKKEVGPQGPQGEQGPQGQQGEQGPGAKTYEFNMTFDAGSAFSYHIISGLPSNFSNGDALLGFILYDQYSGTKYWASLPYTSVNRVYLFNFNENTGTFWINLKNATTGADLPFTSSTTLGFRAVHVKSSFMQENPNVDWNNYQQVKQVLNLE